VAVPAQTSILEGETAEVLNCYGHGTVNGVPYVGHVAATVTKGGLTFKAYPPGVIYGTGSTTSTAPRGTVVAGPATISIAGGSTSSPGVLTIKVTPDIYDVNKTVILPPGTNQVIVALESSTNLVHWSECTNGIYGSPDAAQFFRIRMATLPSP
jgi:hypothetical protein